MKSTEKPQTIQQQPFNPKPSENNVFYQLHLYFKEKHFLDGPRNLQIKEFGRMIKTLSFENSTAELLCEKALSLENTFHNPLYDTTAHTSYYQLRRHIIAMATGKDDMEIYVLNLTSSNEDVKVISQALNDKVKDTAVGADNWRHIEISQAVNFDVQYYRFDSKTAALVRGEGNRLKVYKLENIDKLDTFKTSRIKAFNELLYSDFQEYNNWISNKQPKKPTFFTRHTNFEIKNEIDSAIVDDNHKPEHGGCYQM